MNPKSFIYELLLLKNQQSIGIVLFYVGVFDLSVFDLCFTARIEVMKFTMHASFCSNYL